MADAQNPAVALLSRLFGFGHVEGPIDAFANRSDAGGEPFAEIHPQACFSLFGPSGTKEPITGKAAYIHFVTRCAAALADRSDEIMAITRVDEQGAFVLGSAWRKSRATGEELRYEWAMLFRVEDGLITYGTDMLDADAQAFWGRVVGGSRKGTDGGSGA